MFSISGNELDAQDLRAQLENVESGALVVFEGWVRDINQGRKVESLEYQIYHELALKEGARILKEAQEKFQLHGVSCVHREGHLKLGDIAIWIGAISKHRDDAFKATRYIIDEIKHRLPVWKKEHYEDKNSEWVFCKDHHHHAHFDEDTFYQKQEGLISQEKLKKARVLVVGAGGLGCPVLTSLTQAGVGHIRIVDFDKIDVSNIHRQFLYAPHLASEKKAIIAKKRCEELNPFIKVEASCTHFKEDHLNEISLVIDCTDNLHTKYMIHDLCFKKKIPLISASIFKYEGILRTFLPQSSFGCFRCFESQTPRDEFLGNCNDYGVLGASVNALGSLQASEAIQFISKGENTSLKESLYLNLSNFEQIKIKNKAKENCSTCQGRITRLDMSFVITKEQVGDGVLVDIRELSDDEVFLFKNKNEKVVLSCHRGNRSHHLVSELRRQGFSHFYSLQGGACSL